MEANTSLIAFSDHSIYLVDMSYEYTVEPTQYRGHKQRICDIQPFLSDHFVSLDDEGSVLVWTLKETEIGRRRVSRIDDPNIGARQTFSPSNFRARCEEPLQTINNIDRISSIFIHHAEDVSEPPKLFAATVRGKMLLYYWLNDKQIFEQRESHSFRVKDDIVKMCMVPPTETNENILMTINRTAQLAFYSLKDNGFIGNTESNFPHEAPLNIYRMSRTPTKKHAFVVVFPGGLHQIQLTKMNLNAHEYMMVEYIAPYRLAAEQNTITCCAKTSDNEYLILGTKKGIIVLDKTNREILRSSISDNLTSIDVCTVRDSECNYMVISTTRKGKSVAYVNGINFKDNLMHWSTNKVDSPMNARASTVAWFRGEKAFDVCNYSSGIDEQFVLVAADFKNVVHIKYSVDAFGQTASLELFENDVKNISIGQRHKYVGCSNGDVWDVGIDKVLVMDLGEPVEYLKYYNDIDVLIASSRSQYKVETHNQIQLVFSSVLIQNTFVYMQRFIIVLKINGSFEVKKYICRNRRSSCISNVNIFHKF